eukprot:3611641-Amphidinium_carterae.1
MIEQKQKSVVTRLLPTVCLGDVWALATNCQQDCPGQSVWTNAMVASSLDGVPLVYMGVELPYSPNTNYNVGQIWATKLS